MFRTKTQTTLLMIVPDNKVLVKLAVETVVAAIYRERQNRQNFIYDASAVKQAKKDVWNEWMLTMEDGCQRIFANCTKAEAACARRELRKEFKFTIVS